MAVLFVRDLDAVTVLFDCDLDETTDLSCSTLGIGIEWWAPNAGEQTVHDNSKMLRRRVIFLFVAWL